MRADLHLVLYFFVRAELHIVYVASSLVLKSLKRVKDIAFLIYFAAIISLFQRTRDSLLYFNAMYGVRSYYRRP